MNVLIGTALALVLLPMGADSLNGRSIMSPCPGGQTDSEALFSTTFSDSVTCRWFKYQESCAEAHLKDTLDSMPWIENESTDIAADSAAIILNCPQACEDCPSWLSRNECTDNEDISFPTRFINVNSIHSDIYIGCLWVRLFLDSCAEDYLKDNLEALGYGSTDIAADSAAMRFYCPLQCGDCSPSPSPNECTGKTKAGKCRKITGCFWKEGVCLMEAIWKNESMSVSEEVDEDSCKAKTKAKKCKKMTSCVWNKGVCSQFDCTALTKRKCKKEDKCLYTTDGMCITLDVVVDACAGLKKNPCKQDDACKYKSKTKTCVSEE